MSRPGIIFFGSAASVLILAYPIRQLLKNAGVVDRPNQRSSHSIPTVRGGGLVFLTVIAVAGSLLSWQAHDAALLIIVGASLVLGAVSFIDDLQGLPRMARFGCHAACSLATLAACGFPRFVFNLSPDFAWSPPFIVGGILLCLWIAGYTNAFNFMDGINGIATSQATLTSGASALILLLAKVPSTDVVVLFNVAIAGATAGFFPWNFPRARMFMGDVGSAPLGFLSASVVVWAADKYGDWLFIPLMLLHANYILDTVVTLGRRIARGERWYEPHREHFYQRLTRSGKSHTYVTLLETALQLTVVGAVAAYQFAAIEVRFALVVFIFSIWLGFFAYCETQWRRSLAWQSLSEATSLATANIDKRPASQ